MIFIFVIERSLLQWCSDIVKNNSISTWNFLIFVTYMRFLGVLVMVQTVLHSFILMLYRLGWRAWRLCIFWYRWLSHYILEIWRERGVAENNDEPNRLWWWGVSSKLWCKSDNDPWPKLFSLLFTKAMTSRRDQGRRKIKDLDREVRRYFILIIESR